VSSKEPESSLRAARAAADSLEQAGHAEPANALRGAVAELELWHRELMRRTGEALGVHHDMRNALTGILGNAQLLQMGPAVEQPGVRKRLDSIVREAERIRDLTERLHQARADLLTDGNDTEPANDSNTETDLPSTEAA
jgi:signal transduction histidine kinase